jgi:hypothetical protein
MATNIPKYTGDMPDLAAQGQEEISQNMTNFANYINALPTPLNTLASEVEALEQQTESNAAIATTKSNESLSNAASAAASANQASTYADAIDGQNLNLMTESEFQALAARRREEYAASGFVEFGKMYTTKTYPNINIGIQTRVDVPNVFQLGSGSIANIGTGSNEPCLSVNGVFSKIRGTKYSNEAFPNYIDLPPAPTVTHADSTNSGLVVNGTGLTGTTFTQSVTISGINQVHVIEYTDNGISKRSEVTPAATPYTISLSGTDITRVAMYPKSALSRQDLVFLETFDEDISEKGNFVYPYGNIQYRGDDVDGLTGIADGSFTGADTYSLFGNWQTAGDLVGKGYDWGTLSDAQKAIFAGNPENNLRKDGDKILQTQYKICVEQGLDDSPSITDYGYVQVDTDKGLYYNSTTGNYGIEIAAVSRNNSGIFHPVFNQFGTAKTTDSKYWYDTATTIASTIDCFNPSRVGGTIASGVSGSPDGSYSDAIMASLIIDLRNSAHEKPKAELLEDIKRSLISGEKRSDFDGDGVWETIGVTSIGSSDTSGINNFFNVVDTTVLQNVKVGDTAIIVARDADYTNPIRYYAKVYEVGNDYVRASLDGGSSNDFSARQAGDSICFVRKSTHKQSGQKLHCDIIGKVSNYGTWADSLTNGYTLQGTPLLVSEEGASMLPDGVETTFKLSNKATAVEQVLKSTDNGATWATASYTLNSTANTITFNTAPPVDDLIMVNYTTTDNPTYPAVNSECLEIGDVWAGSSPSTTQGNLLTQALLGKVGTSYGTIFENLTSYQISTKELAEPSDRRPTHEFSDLQKFGTASPTVKALFTLSQENGRYCVDVKFKEMKYDTTWGDDNKIDIVDNVTTTIDTNGNTILIGNKRVKTNYFVKEK